MHVNSTCVKVQKRAKKWKMKKMEINKLYNEDCRESCHLNLKFKERIAYESI